MGIVWGMIYYKHPNFWGVTISHAVLGIVSIATGLI
jgi:membrane protease YdiL (CAAX protease family)